MPTQAERSENTRAKLLAAARAAFATRGFAATSVDAVVRRARLTKGAFYHHFKDKKAVFRAVLEDVAASTIGGAKAAAKGATALDLLRAGCNAYLDAILDPGVQRIVLVDGPAVLGWHAWREVDWRFGLPALEAALRIAASGERAGTPGRVVAAHADRAARRRPRSAVPSPAALRTQAHLLFGAICEGAMVIARAPRPREAEREVRRALDALLAQVTRAAGRRRPGGAS